MCTLVKDLCDRLEGFLACRVPNLKLHVDVLHSNEQRTKFDTDGHLVVLRELVVTHTMHQARLAYATIADHNKLE